MQNDTINIELLQTYSMGEVRHLMTESGLGWKNTDKKAELIQRYAEFKMTAQPSDVYAKEEEIKPKPRHVPKPAEKSELEQALSDFIGRGLLLTTDNTTWNVKYSSREDSGHLSMGIPNILRCVERLFNAA